MRSRLGVSVNACILCVALSLCFACESTAQQAVRPGKALPPISAPVMFDTPVADRILEAMQIFPQDNAWNADISAWPLHPKSRQIVESIGADKVFRGNPDMAFILVPPDQKRIALKINEYPDESDPGPFPLPDNAPIEGWPASYRRDQNLQVSLEDVQRDKLKQGGDRHVIVVDPHRGLLYEFFHTLRTDAGWQASQASIFDLTSNKLRPEGWTSADAAGLPIFPAIVRYDELARGQIDHALRVTVRRTQRAYVHPATHFASRLTDANLPRMGERLRLKADFNISNLSPQVQTICKALKKHGMLVADNGIEWAVSLAPDERIPSLHAELRKIKGADFEVVERPR